MYLKLRNKNQNYRKNIYEKKITKKIIKLDVAEATFKNLLKMAVSKERLNKTDMERVG